MALVTRNDKDILTKFKVLSAYDKYRKDLIDVAKIVYQTLIETNKKVEEISKVSPSKIKPNDCVELLSISLIATVVWASLLNEIGLILQDRSLIDRLTKSIARFIIENEWEEIIKK